MNGRRLAPYALSGGQSVDLSGIPARRIERVEVLKDGASAIYGTDAIGGVINFILRKDYQGAEVNANYFATEQGGGNNGRVSVTAGLRRPREGQVQPLRFRRLFQAGCAEGVAAREHEDRVSSGSWRRQDQRDLVPGQHRADRSHTGETYGFSGHFNPTIPFPGGATATSCAPPVFVPDAQPSRFMCNFDFASTTETIPEAEKANVVGRLTWQIDADHQFFAEGSYYYGKFTQRVSPTPVSSTPSRVPRASLPPTSPYYPDSVRRRAARRRSDACRSSSSIASSNSGRVPIRPRSTSGTPSSACRARSRDGITSSPPTTRRTSRSTAT